MVLRCGPFLIPGNAFPLPLSNRLQPLPGVPEAVQMIEFFNLSQSLGAVSLNEHVIFPFRTIFLTFHKVLHKFPILKL
jgi:hypothetical protein